MKIIIFITLLLSLIISLDSPYIWSKIPYPSNSKELTYELFKKKIVYTEKNPKTITINEFTVALIGYPFLTDLEKLKYISGSLRLQNLGDYTRDCSFLNKVGIFNDLYVDNPFILPELPKTYYKVDRKNITVNFYVKNNNFKPLIKKAMEYWSNNKIKFHVNFCNDDNNCIIVSERNIPITVANPFTHGIFISKKSSVPDELMPIIFAHEFGHILGFADAYDDYYDCVDKKWVYYSLDPNSIMGDSHGRVTDKMMSFIKQRYFR